MNEPIQDIYRMEFMVDLIEIFVKILFYQKLY